jgi:hypothetical protein
MATMSTKADLISATELASLDRTPIAPRPNGEPMRCVRCRMELPTEGAFARHFVVPDERYLNLGECPTKYNVVPAPRAFGDSWRDGPFAPPIELTP